ncbi:hypothetical protein Slin15195_G061490 [Septoria linicola]|uniref:DUF6590 domain-containing protein n=1 Tax=Septoria linicola TaxID=215465 RepID=A0A9Q9EJA8_9PEZI|nr:hypothetical protein Slin14017_G077290 [Septoria linicola]USW52830.1 hypothetical protein Slin15195_G061490 [Septoria linicola]
MHASSDKVSASNVTVVSNLELRPHDDAAEVLIRGVLRYVIIDDPAEGEDFVWALPITSYGGKGVQKKGIIKREHSVVYTTTTRGPPTQTQEELPDRGEKGMLPNAIEVTPHLPSEKLHIMSRINYGEPTRIAIGTSAHEVGAVHRDSVGWFVNQYKLVREQRRQVAAVSNADSTHGSPGSSRYDDLQSFSDNATGKQVKGKMPESSNTRRSGREGPSERGKSTRAESPTSQEHAQNAQQYALRQVSRDQLAIEAAQVHAAYDRLYAERRPEHEIMQTLIARYSSSHGDMLRNDAAARVAYLLQRTS